MPSTVEFLHCQRQLREHPVAQIRPTRTFRFRRDLRLTPPQPARGCPLSFPLSRCLATQVAQPGLDQLYTPAENVRLLAALQAINARWTGRFFPNGESRRVHQPGTPVVRILSMDLQKS